MSISASWPRLLLRALTLAAGLLAGGAAVAVPSMARQTGYECSRCHAGFPELTNFGRQFKLGAYSMTSDKWDEKSGLEKLPVSGGVMASRTSTSDVNAGGTTASDFPQDRKVISQTLALYYGGRIAENAGGLVQYNYDGIEKKWGMEMFDVRFARDVSIGGKDAVIGVTLNNNPTVSDIYNSTPAWGFPHTDTAARQMPASSLIDMTLVSKVAGVTAYTMWNDAVYVEVGGYRNARRGAARLLSAGQNWLENSGAVVAGTAPYWRLAFQYLDGPQTFEIGTFGLIGKVWQDAADQGLGTNRYRDIAVDARYQYLANGHSTSISTTYIRERKNWSNAAQAASLTSNNSDTLNTLRIDGHYYYQLKWGGGLQYFRTSGTGNSLAYTTPDMLMTSANGSPNSRGWRMEANYFPLQNLKLALRYTRYSEFNGASRNYNGNGRDAAANDSVFLMGWLLF